jgi:hypothetical protein
VCTAFELSSSAQQWAAVAFSKGTPDVHLARSRWDCIDLIVVPVMLRVPIAQPGGETTKFAIDRAAALIPDNLGDGTPPLGPPAGITPSGRVVSLWKSALAPV